MPCFGSGNPSVAPSLGRFQNDDKMTSKGTPIEVIEVPEDDADDFPDSGPQNLAEAQMYRDKIDEIMTTFSDLLADNQKDALRSTVTSLKKLMAKHWHQMSEADIEVIMKSIHDPSCMYLHQHLTTEGIDITEPATEIPEGWTFIRQLPEKIRKTEVWEMIVIIFDMVLKATARPMIQVNVPEHYLSPVQDPPKDNHRRKIDMA